MIMRGAGVCGTAGGAAGRGALGTAGGTACVEAETVGDGGAGGATTAAGGATTGRGGGGAATDGGAWVTAGGAGFSTAGVTIAGRCTGAGGTGAATGTGGADGGAEVAGLATAGTAGGFGATGGTAGRGRTGGAAAASFFCVIALSTSPGREICERSILVLISSSPRIGREVRAEGFCASAEPRINARTFSASWSSMELECVFFSVTPTCGSASRMALLFTSSSLARSLIRTLLIRPFCFPACARSSSQPHGVSFLDSHANVLD